MNDREILQALTDSGAIRTGHFQLTSGLHSDTYVQCARVLEYPDITTKLAEEMVARLPEDLAVDLVVAPAVGGIIIGFAVAQALGQRYLFTERVEGKMTLRRAFEIPKAARVLIVEDVVTTGGSVQEVVEIVEGAGAVVAGVTSIIDRGGELAFDGDYYPLLSMQVESWEPADCAQCGAGAPIDSPGSRRI